VTPLTPGRDQWAASYFATTAAGIRPRSLTDNPCSAAQERIALLTDQRPARRWWRR